MSATTPDATGTHVVQRFHINPSGAIDRRALPADAAQRRAPALNGIGLLARIPADVIAACADPKDSNRDGVSGRVGRGRFGWKGVRRDLEEAVSAAFLNELGLGTALFPDATSARPIEVSGEQVRDVVRFLERLPAPSAPATGVVEPGADLFTAVRCAACHRPTYDLPALGSAPATRIHPYSDLLLHDMGPALADGIAEGGATGSEFRTPPLWGLARNGPPYLHDGRASSVDEAIRAHGGEAERSARAYAALSATDRRTLLTFLAGL